VRKQEILEKTRNTRDSDRFIINANKEVYKVKRELHYGQRPFNSVDKNKEPVKETTLTKRFSSEMLSPFFWP